MLSKIIIFVTRNNPDMVNDSMLNVVNCFQKLLSSWRGTTSTQMWTGSFGLWIAFKNYYLRDEEQHPDNLVKTFLGCELLSKIIIFVTRNNCSHVAFIGWHVVNCFQKLLSSWRGTTASHDYNESNGLWIAFKNYYLRDEEQH